MPEDMADMDIGPELIKAICAAMKEIGHVAPTGKNTHHGYNYLSEEDILNAVQPALYNNGLVISPVRVHTLEPQPSGNQIRQDILVTYLVAHESGRFFFAQAPGCGTDSLDKAVYKAMTGAFKYVLRQTFSIADEISADDAEDDGKKKVEPKKKAPTSGLKSLPSDPDWYSQVGAALGEFQELCGASFEDCQAIIREHGGVEMLSEVADEAVPTILTRLALEYSESDLEVKGLPALRAAEALFR